MAGRGFHAHCQVPITWLCMAIWLHLSGPPVTWGIIIDGLPEVTYEQHGDLKIGVLLPVHSYNLTYHCGVRVRDLGMLQRLEALAYAVREINNRSDLLPDHTLGFVMYDDCYKDITGLGQALHFASQGVDTCMLAQQAALEQCDNDSLKMQRVSAVLGSEGSAVTTQIANLYSSLKMPQVSYASTSPNLDNRHRYSNFIRMVPSDVHQARAIVALLLHFKWLYVNLLYAEGYYGDEAKQALQEEIGALKDARICFAQVVEMKHSFTKQDYKRLVYSLLLGNTKANVVIVFATVHEGLLLLEQVRALSGGKRLTWIASDAWVRAVHELRGFVPEMRGGMSVNFQLEPVQRFNEYFGTLGPGTPSENPWMEKFWQQNFHCSPNDRNQDTNCSVNGCQPNFNGSLRGEQVEVASQMLQCNSSLRFTQHDMYFPDIMIPLVFDAVYSIAHALHQALYSHTCSHSPYSEQRQLCAEKHLSSYLANVSFTGENGEVVVGPSGSVIRSYVINNVHITAENNYTLVPVAHWNMTDEHISGNTLGKLEFTGAAIQWIRGDVPVSACSSPCGPGQVKAYEQVECCWNCKNCLPHEFVDATFKVARCAKCKVGMWPEQEHRNHCVAIVPTYPGSETGVAIVLACIASLGLISCLAVSAVFILKRNHPLIKASSRELCAMMQLGLGVSYLFTFVFLLRPTADLCYLRNLGWGLTFTLMFAPLVTKTVRILRIFQAGRALKRNPDCVSIKTQVGIASNIILVHTLIAVGWMSGAQPTVVTKETSPSTLVLTCSTARGLLALSIAYNSILLLAAVVCAFLTRRLPDNFSESRFISFCVYSTVVIHLSFLPAYYFVDDVSFENLFISLAITSTATIIQLFIFLPKIYAIYFVAVEKQRVVIKMFKRRSTRSSYGGEGEPGKDDSSVDYDIQEVSLELENVRRSSQQSQGRPVARSLTQNVLDTPDLLADNPASQDNQ